MGTGVGSTSKLNVDAFRALLGAVDALRNGRALLAVLGCTVAGLLAAGVLAALAVGLGIPVALPGFLALAIALATGANAAGILLLEQARGLATSSLKDALGRGLACIPSAVGLGLLALISTMTVLAVLAVVYLLCKTPFLGPIAFAVVFPFSVVITGLGLWGVFAGLMLALAATWGGATLVRSVAQVWAIARTRLAETLLLLAGAGFVAAAVGVALLGVLIVGLVPTLALAAAIFGDDALGWVAGLALDGGDAHGLAAGIGGGMLWAMAASLVALVGMQGLNLVYLRVSDGVDGGDAEAAIAAALDGARRHGAGFGQKVRAMAVRLRPEARRPEAAEVTLPKPTEPSGKTPTSATPATLARPRVAPPESTTPAIAKALTCPHCLSAVGASDRFCAACGYALT